VQGVSHSLDRTSELSYNGRQSGRVGCSVAGIAGSNWRSAGKGASMAALQCSRRA